MECIEVIFGSFLTQLNLDPSIMKDKADCTCTSLTLGKGFSTRPNEKPVGENANVDMEYDFKEGVGWGVQLRSTRKMGGGKGVQFWALGPDPLNPSPQIRTWIWRAERSLTSHH